MDLITGKKVGVTTEEKNLSYYKFFEREMAKIPEEKIALIEKPSEIPAVPFEQKNLYLAGEDKNFCQIGYGIFEDGTGFGCNETFMPKVEGKMLDWWFVWSGIGSDLRYKIWDSEDHYFARTPDVKKMLDKNIPMNQRMWETDNYVVEDIGMGPMPINLHFQRPKNFGYDEKIIGTEFCESLVTGVGGGDCAVAMTHKWYPVEGGVMFVSRFWIGYGIVDGEVKKILPEGAKVPIEIPKFLYWHNIKEYSNLAAILPEVYAENKDNW